MWFEQENILTASVKAYLDHREKTKKWVSVGIICIFIVYIILALWIAYIVKDVEDVNTLKKEAITREIQTDSLKREAIRELVQKYNESLKKWNKMDNGRSDNGTPKK